MAPSARLVVLGSYNRDTVLSVAHLPAPGETLRADAVHGFHGGKGSNQAVQAARLAANVSLVAAIGQDEAGDAALALWHAEGIDTASVQRMAGAQTGSAIILVDRAAENLIVVAPGANDRLDGTVGLDFDRIIGEASLILAQLETPIETTIAAFAAARRLGVTTMLNAAPMPEHLPAALLDLVDILVVNEIEAATLAGALAIQATRPEALLGHVRLAILLTQGARGAILYCRDHDPLFQPAARIEAIDTTGAGDALTGAFAAQLAAAGGWSAALRWGVAAGSHACKGHGAIPSLGGLAAIAEMAASLPPASMSPPVAEASI